MLNVCTWRPSMVTLRDGRQVLSDSEEWLEECLARHVLAMPLAERRRWLFGSLTALGDRKGGYQQRHGEEATERLKQVITEVWEAKRPANDNRQ